MNVCVIGLGEVGLPTALYIKDKGLDVFGYDINSIAVKKAQKVGIKAFSDWNKVPKSEVYVICVSTGLKKDKPSFESIFDVCKKISKKMDGQLISIESTIIPGLSRNIYREIFKEKVYLVHVPHRYWKEDPINYGVKQLRVIGGINSESLKRGISFYRDILEIPIYIASSIEIAEMSKIVENSYRYLEIAFAEELKMICNELGLNFEDVREACNTKWNIKILEARDGIRGHCLPKDIKYLMSLTNYKKLLESAITVDEEYKKMISNKCL